MVTINREERMTENQTSPLQMEVNGKENTSNNNPINTPLIPISKQTVTVSVSFFVCLFPFLFLFLFFVAFDNSAQTKKLKENWK